MRKTILFLILATPAQAQVGNNPDLLVRDRTGKVIERLEPGRYDTWTRRDSRGNFQGTAETDRSGRTILRAPGGRVQGTIEPAPSYRSPSPSSRER